MARHNNSSVACLRGFWFSAGLLLWLGMAGVSAQPLVMPVAANESEGETIARCLRDLRSEDVEARRRAAMVIGKYQQPVAQEAVLGCLRDPDAMVRRSALVSLTEEDRMLSVVARREVFRLLADPDVHIRRIASSMLGEISVGMRGVVILPTRSGPLRPGVAAGGQALADADREVLYAAQCLNQALADDDASVRRNVLSAARFYPGVLDRVRLEGFFTDTSVEIRVLALQAYASLMGHEGERAQALSVLLTDVDARVRAELARASARLGAAGTALLRELSRDAVLPVRLEAVRLYAAQQDPAALPLLTALIADEAVPVDDRVALLQVLNVYPDAAGPVYEALLEGGAAPLRAAAIRALGTGRVPGAGAVRGIAFYIDCLDDESDAVVQAAAAVVQQRQQELTPAALAQLLGKRNPEARKLALRCTAGLAPAEIADLLLDACLDESVPVRQQAMQLLVGRQIPGWREILLASLDDSQVAIQQTAADGLLRAIREPAVREALASYAERCPEPFLKQRIEQLLQAKLPPLPVVPAGPLLPEAVQGAQPPMPVPPNPVPLRRRVVPRRR